MSIPLKKNNNGRTSKYLVFTSAGDHSNIDQWLIGRKNFDIWISYYGEEDTIPHQNDCSYYMTKKGGKFPALHYVYQHWKDVIDKYDAIMVMDDDIIIRGSEISHLFELRDKYDIWILQPSFNPKGKISHPITHHWNFSTLRFTNFVEVTCPLFRKDKIDTFMNTYDPNLICWGVDWWFINTLGENIEGKVAIIDEISCINPKDDKKGGKREIDLLQTTDERIDKWEQAKAIHHLNIKEGDFKQFGQIKMPFGFHYIKDTLKAGLQTVRSFAVIKNH